MALVIPQPPASTATKIPIPASGTHQRARRSTVAKVCCLSVSNASSRGRSCAASAACSEADSAPSDTGGTLPEACMALSTEWPRRAHSAVNENVA